MVSLRYFYIDQAWTIDFWLNEAGAPKEKIIVGIATYGMTFTLADPKDHGLKAAAVGGGRPGPYTGESGILAYYEVCCVCVCVCVVYYCLNMYECMSVCVCVCVCGYTRETACERRRVREVHG